MSPRQHLNATLLAPVATSLEKKGTPIGALDTMIAAHAVAVGATLVTHNVREFARVKELAIVDWLKR